MLDHVQNILVDRQVFRFLDSHGVFTRVVINRNLLLRIDHLVLKSGFIIRVNKPIIQLLGETIFLEKIKLDNFL